MRVYLSLPIPKPDDVETLGPLKVRPGLLFKDPCKILRYSVRFAIVNITKFVLISKKCFSRYGIRWIVIILLTALIPFT